MVFKIYTFTFDLNNLSFDALKSVFFDDVKKSISIISQYPFVKEVTILQKCNCSEIILVTDQDYSSFSDKLLKFWAENSQGLINELWQKLKIREGRDAINHILSTSCGLKSILLGDNQVPGQVRAAFKLAKELNAGGEILELIIHFCRKAYMEVEERTSIFNGNTSLGRAGVEIILNNPKNSKILVVGAGEIAEVVVNALSQKGFNNVSIANRTLKKAEVLAVKKKFEYLDITKALLNIDNYQISFFTTSKQNLFSINQNNFLNLNTVIDLGNPKNVQIINKPENLKIYGIEDIKKNTEINFLKRKEDVKKASLIVKENADLFFEELDKSLNGKSQSQNISLIRERLRSKEFHDILRFRSFVIQAIRDFYTGRSFLEIDFPSVSIVATDPVRTHNELFSVNWYGKKLFLAQSVQLHKQMMVLSGFERIFSISKFWREEQNRTPRHLGEAWSLDIEFVVDDYTKIMQIIEEMISYITNRIREDKTIPNYIKSKIKIPKVPFKRVTYKEAVDLLESVNCKIDYGEDIGYDRELKLYNILHEKYGGEFFFIHSYPNTVKKFYTKVKEDNTTQTFDLIYKGWELVSGAQRENNPSALSQKIKLAGLSIPQYSFYLSLFDKTSPMHGGFGMGIDRLVAKMLDLKDLIEVVPFPRTRENIIP